MKKIEAIVQSEVKDAVVADIRFNFKSRQNGSCLIIH